MKLDPTTKHMPSPLRRSIPLLALVLVAACASNAPGRPTGAAGSSSAGASGTGGASADAAGAGGASGGAGTQDASDAATGSAGATAGDGSTDDGGATDANSTSDAAVPHKQYSCPSGNLGAQSMGAMTPVCVGFQFAYDWNEGPTWIASQNAFFFSNFVEGNPGGDAGGDIIKLYMDGHCEVWLHDVGTNGLAVSATGNIMAACHKTRSVTEFDVVTKEAHIVANMYMGQDFDSPNDIVVRSNGTIYFTNPDFELGGRPPGFGPAVFRIDPMGVVSLIDKLQGGEPNGIGLSPDETTLYVVGAGVWALDDNGVPTTMTNQSPPNADGFAVDCEGNIIIQGTNSSFGGPDGKTLLVVGGGTAVNTIQMTVPGLP